MLRKAEPVCGALTSHGNHFNGYVTSKFSTTLCEDEKMTREMMARSQLLENFIVGFVVLEDVGLC